MISHIQNKTVDDAFINISHFLAHFIMLIFAKAAYDAGQYFEVNYEQRIGYGTLGLVLFGACAPISARLADHYSRSLMMVIYHFGIGIAAIFTSFSQSLISMMMGLALIGVFASIYHPVGIAILLKRNSSVGFRLGVNGVFGNMGVAFAPLIMGLILLHNDWRSGFMLSGLFCLVYGIIFACNLKPDTTENTRQSAKTNKYGFVDGWRRALFALALITSAGGFIFGGMTFLVPRYFELEMQNLTTSVAITGLLASIVYAMASFAQIGVGWLIDRISAKTVLLCIAVGQVIFVFLAASFSDLALFFFMIIAMSFVFGQIPITDVVMSRYVPDSWRSRILSIKFLLNLCIGASVLPLSGYMLQTGYQMSDLFSLMSMIACLIFLSGFVLPSLDKNMI
jgi:MFS family permease